MDINTLIHSYETQVASNRARQETADRELRSLLDAAKREGRASLTATESSRSDHLFAEIDAAKAAGREAQVKLDRARAVESEEAEVTRRSYEIRDSGARLPKYDEVARIGAEKREYGPHNDPQGKTSRLTLSAHRLTVILPRGLALTGICRKSG